MLTKITWYWNLIHYSVYKFLKNQSFTRPSIHAGGLMIGLTGFLLFGLFDYSQIFFSISLDDLVFRNDNNAVIFLLFFIAAPSLIFNYFTLFKANKYLQYFTEFDGLDKNELKKYYWMSSILILLMASFFIVSFKFTK
jgi:hypothetical protein